MKRAGDESGRYGNMEFGDDVCEAVRIFSFNFAYVIHGRRGEGFIDYLTDKSFFQSGLILIIFSVCSVD